MFKLFKPKKKYLLNYFCTPLVSHCNLNCRYCDHFSPLAKEEFFDVKQIEKDFKRISKFFDVKSIGLMGGEPLLHPEVTAIIKITRKIFPLPSTHLMLFTNGILLPKMKGDFYRTLAENKIVIRLTGYKINLDLNSIMENAHKYGVRIELEGSEYGQFKTMHKLALDLDGKQNQNEMFRDCWHRKICCYFENGRFYNCPVVGNIRHFNEYFNKNLVVENMDFLDIYKVKGDDEIQKYFSTPMNFCKYCNVRAEKADLPFEISKKDIADWCLN